MGAILDVFVKHVARVCRQLSVKQRNDAHKVLEDMTGDAPNKMRAVLSPVLGAGSEKKTASSALPAGWSAHTDSEGRVFYHHEKHGSQWNLPLMKELPVGWAMHKTAEGATYYHHPQHGSQWVHPDETPSGKR